MTTAPRSLYTLHHQFGLAEAGHVEPLAIAAIRAEVADALEHLPDHGPVTEDPADATVRYEFGQWALCTPVPRIHELTVIAALYALEGLSAFRRTENGVDVPGLRHWLEIKSETSRRQDGMIDGPAFGLTAACLELCAHLPDEIPREDVFEVAGRAREAAARRLAPFAAERDDAHRAAVYACVFAADMLARANSGKREAILAYLDHRAEWMTMVGESFMAKDKAAE